MFGDIGHGGALFIFGNTFIDNSYISYLALILCLKREEIIKSGSVLSHVLIVRWLLLFMGFFAMYAGFIYNDFLSIPWNLFGSCYTTVKIPVFFTNFLRRRVIMVQKQEKYQTVPIHLVIGNY